MSDIIRSLMHETSEARAMLANMADVLGDDVDLIANTIEGETNLRETITIAVKRVVELNALIDGIDAMVAGIKARGERLDKQRDLLRTLIATAMETAGEKRIETSAATVSLRNVPPKVQIIDEQAIPTRYWRQPDPVVDKRALLAALKEGEVSGAMLDNGSVTVTIKGN